MELNSWVETGMVTSGLVTVFGLVMWLLFRSGP